MQRTDENELQRKLLAAHATGNGSLRALEEMFGVCLGWVEKVFRQHRRAEHAERV